MTQNNRPEGRLNVHPNPTAPSAYRPSVRNTDPVTSHKAAQSARVEPLRTQVLAALTAAGASGCTDCELDQHLKGARSSVAKRRGELVQRGLVEDSGQTRKTQYGCDAIVWVVA